MGILLVVVYLWPTTHLTSLLTVGAPNFRSHLTAGALISHANCLVVLLPPALWHLLQRSEVACSTTRLFNFTPLCIVLRPALSCQNLTLYDAYDIFLVSIFYCANFSILILSIFNMKSPRGCWYHCICLFVYWLLFDYLDKLLFVFRSIRGKNDGNAKTSDSSRIKSLTQQVWSCLVSLLQ